MTWVIIALREKKVIKKRSEQKKYDSLRTVHLIIIVISNNEGEDLNRSSYREGKEKFKIRDVVGNGRMNRRERGGTDAARSRREKKNYNKNLLTRKESQMRYKLCAKLLPLC